MTPEQIRACVPLLYEVPQPLHVPATPEDIQADRRRWKDSKRSSYAMKHDVEHLLGEYVSNEELIAALRSSLRGGPQIGSPNYLFFVKPKFDLHWLRVKPTVRPKGARMSHWEAYQSALAASGSQQTPQSSPAHSSLQDEPRPCSP
jgi:hypothetical protein